MPTNIPPYFQETWMGKILSLEKKHWLGGGAAICGGLALLIAYFQSGPNSFSYIQGEEAFAKWEASTHDEALYQEMARALKKAPALEKRFEAPIAQKLIEGDKIKEASLWAKEALEVLKKEAPFHASYSETSLLIEEKAFQKALERSVTLKEEMVRELNLEKISSETPLGGGAVLYAQNLLRIAFLQKELGNRPGEKAAWQELENYLEKQGSIADLIYGNFREKGVDLTSFIEARRKEL